MILEKGFIQPILCRQLPALHYTRVNSSNLAFNALEIFNLLVTHESP